MTATAQAACLDPALAVQEEIALVTHRVVPSATNEDPMPAHTDLLNPFESML
jgi:hypothetical protein